jgi:hypothetical protein
MAYVITDGTNYGFIDTPTDEIINGRLFRGYNKKYPMLSDMYKTKFLAKARPYKTRKEAEKDLPFAKLILKPSTLKIKRVLKKDLKEIKVFKGWNLITKESFNFGKE